jgi:DNA-binding transcriptional regulator YhcF (GntR family)
MILEVDVASAVPPYEQIREQIERMAVSGVIPQGFRLPSIRQLAADLGLAPATVARTYTELESAGIVQSRRGRGTTIAGNGHKLTRSQTQTELGKAADAFARRIHQLGIDRKTALSALEKAFTALARSAGQD